MAIEAISVDLFAYIGGRVGLARCPAQEGEFAH